MLGSDLAASGEVEGQAEHEPLVGIHESAEGAPVAPFRELDEFPDVVHPLPLSEYETQSGAEKLGGIVQPSDESGGFCSIRGVPRGRGREGVIFRVWRTNRSMRNSAISSMSSMRSTGM